MLLLMYRTEDIRQLHRCISLNTHLLVLSSLSTLCSSEVEEGAKGIGFVVFELSM